MRPKIILTCAVTGNAPLHPKYPAALEYPITPAQIARAAVDATKAGASIVHCHVRDPATGNGSRAAPLFKEVVDRIRSDKTDVCINLTAGLGAIFLPDPDDESRAAPGSDVVSVPERVKHLVECLPEIASLDITTGNQVEGPLEFVYLNTTRTLRGMAKRFQELGVKPELECFAAGDVLFGRQLIDEGLIDGVPFFQFVLGVKWCAPADPESMIYMRGLLPPKAVWTSFGISRMQFPMAAQAVLLGGNVRVGLEDNLYLSRGTFATNTQLVERAVKLIEILGGSVATPQEAREILQLKGKRDSVHQQGIHRVA